MNTLKNIIHVQGQLLKLRERKRVIVFPYRETFNPNKAHIKEIPQFKGTIKKLDDLTIFV